MVRYALLLCLVLFVGNNKAASVFEHEIRFHELPTEDAELYLHRILSGKSIDEKQFFMVYFKNQVFYDRIHMVIYSYNEEKKSVHNCSLFLKHGQDVTEVTRLDNGKVAFVWHKYQKDNKRKEDDYRTTAVMVDPDNCQKYDLFSTDNELYIRTTKANESYVIVTADSILINNLTCVQIGLCFDNTYEPKSKILGLPEPILVDPSWSDLSIERLNEEELLVHGLQGRDYKVIRRGNRSNEVMTLTNVDRNLQFINDGLTFCWINHPAIDRSVHCVRYDEKNRLVFAKTVFFDEAVILVKIHAAHKNEIILITAEKNCHKYASCTSYSLTNVHLDGSLEESLQLPLLCSEGPVFSEFVRDIAGGVSFRYVCKGRDEIYDNTISIDIHDSVIKADPYGLDGCVKYGNGWICL